MIQHGGFCGCDDCCSCCPRPPFMQPLSCNPARFSDAGAENGATLILHNIVLEPCGNQSCTPRILLIRITGPSYPCGEVFPLRVGSCVELDEPLIISGLLPGQYTIEELFTTPNEYVCTLTGPVCGRCVTLVSGGLPTIVTLVSRKRLCRLCRGYGCSASAGCGGV